jgi:hypothetical protein
MADGCGTFSVTASCTSQSPMIYFHRQLCKNVSCDAAHAYGSNWHLCSFQDSQHLQRPPNNSWPAARDCVDATPACIGLAGVEDEVHVQNEYLSSFLPVDCRHLQVVKPLVSFGFRLYCAPADQHQNYCNDHIKSNKVLIFSMLVV